MDWEEIQLYLAAVRWGTQDEQEQEVQEALRATQEDPELQEWLDHMKATDRFVAQRIRRIAIPDELQDLLLELQRRIIPAWRVRLYSVLALGLSVLFWIAVVGWIPAPQARYTIQDFAATLLPQTFQDGEKGLVLVDNFEQLQQKLAAHHFRIPPRTLRQLRPLTVDGYRLFSWNGKQVLLVRFIGPGIYFHLLLTTPSGFINAPTCHQLYRGSIVPNDLLIPIQGNPTQPPKPTKGWVYGVWVEDGQLCLLACDGSMGDLERYLVK